jgi:hypothetical protein
MAKGEKKSRTPVVWSIGAKLDGRGGLKATMPRRFGEKVDDLKSPAGKPRHYDHAALIDVAEDISKHGAADTYQSWFFERVREECGRRRPRIKAPGDDRTLARIVGHVYKLAKMRPR